MEIEKYNLWNEDNKEENELIAKIFGCHKDETRNLELDNIIISDVRIDQNETTFNDIAARVLNFNKKQEVQRVHNPKFNHENTTEYGAINSNLELFAEGKDTDDHDAVRKAM
jgi:hypothetical protein